MGMKKRALDKGVVPSEGVLTPPRGDRHDTRPNHGIVIAGERATARSFEPMVSDGFRNQTDNFVNASRRDVKEYSEAEPLAEEGLQRTLKYAERVSKVVAERNKKEGRVVFTCPFCTSDGKRNVQFEEKTEKLSEKACAAHIKKEHTMAKKAKVLEKAPKSAYQPRRRVIPPILQASDLVAPEHKRFYEGIEIARRDHGHIRERAIQARGGRQAGHFNVRQFIMQTESAAISKLPTLNDAALELLVKEAQNKGKRILFRAASKALRDRIAFSKAS